MTRTLKFCLSDGCYENLSTSCDPTYSLASCRSVEIVSVEIAVEHEIKGNGYKHDTIFTSKELLYIDIYVKRNHAGEALFH